MMNFERSLQDVSKWRQSGHIIGRNPD